MHMRNRSQHPPTHLNGPILVHPKCNQMAPNWVWFILFLNLVIFVFAFDLSESGCARKDALVEREGRLCAAPCTRQRTCRSPERECRCDGVCGRTCVIKGLECPVLDNPNDGIVFLNERQLGSKATYSCERGFKLIGLAERVCQGDGSWSGLEPKCLEQVRCYADTFPRSDGILYQKERQLWYLNEETVGFICSSRYQLTSGNLKGYIECLEGQWLLPKYTCEPRSCPPFLSTDLTLIIESNNIFKHGESIALTCYNDYILQGSSQITCHFGSWLMPNGRTYCRNIEYEDEDATSDSDVNKPDNINADYDLVDFETTTVVSTTPEPEIDDGITIPIIEWSLENGGAVETDGKLYVHENSDLHLLCKWPLSRGTPLWGFSQSREAENYKLDENEDKHTSLLIVWAVQEDDSGEYSCFSPLEKQENVIIISVIRQSTDEENQTNIYEFNPPTEYSCVFHRPINTIAWHNERYIRDGDYIADKGVVRISCRQIGLFLLVGSGVITCSEGVWVPENDAKCIRLKRNSEIMPPPIDILAPYVILNDGSIAVDPRQNLALDCLWVMPPEPQDSWYHATWYRSDTKGNLVLPAQIISQKTKHGDGQFYSYRLTLDAVENEDTTYTCLTPENESNFIRIRFTYSYCKFQDAPIPLNVILSESVLKPLYLPEERIEMRGCKNNKQLVGLKHITCSSSGVWSNPLFSCR